MAAVLLTAALSMLLVPSPALCQGLVLAEIDDIYDEGLYRKAISLSQDVEVEIEAISSGIPEKDILFSYAWLLNLNSGEPIWVMDSDRVEKIASDNIREKTTITLPAGDYQLYFAAFRGLYPFQKKIKILKMFEVGVFDINRMPMEWDDHGDPSRWQVVVRATDADFPRSAVKKLAERPNTGAMLKFKKVRSTEFLQAEMLIHETVSLRIKAMGEYIAKEKYFADGAWIDDLNRCEKVWGMNLTNTRHAGGAQKNRSYNGKVTLPPGRYMVNYVSDDSHSYREWNMPPPYDPEAWGIEVIPIDAAGENAVEIVFDPPERNLVAKLDRMSDNEFKRTGFTLLEDADLCIHAFGEWALSEKIFVDFGWIEDARTLEKVWEMPYSEGAYAGGEYRNRQVRDLIHLPVGDYYLCYITDYAHAYGNWQQSPPYDPRAWGIKLQGAGENFTMDQVKTFKELEGPSLLIRIGPIGDDIHKLTSFRVVEPTTVKMISVGEGYRGEMFDYAWLKDDASEEIVWEMEYDETSAAGGSRKNRSIEHVLTIPPGQYSLHYRTDDNHSFENWNEDMPTNPHLWGVTMLEVEEENDFR